MSLIVSVEYVASRAWNSDSEWQALDEALDRLYAPEPEKNPWVKISKGGTMPDSFCLVEVIDGDDFSNRCFVMFTDPTDFTHFYSGNRYWRYATPPPTL